MGDHERYHLEVIREDGRPLAPAKHVVHFISQCGVVVRDHIPITVRDWNKPTAGGASYVGTTAKEHLWRKLMVNFTLPALEVDPDEEDPNETEKIAKQKKS